MGAIAPPAPIGGPQPAPVQLAPAHSATNAAAVQ